MKIFNKIILTVLVFSLNHTLFAQDKTERFCEISVYFGKPKHPHITIDIGNNSPAFRDTAIITDLNKAKSFNSVTDVLNHMAKSGWTLVSVNNLSWNTFFYFKRQFNGSEFHENPISLDSKKM